MLQVFSDSSKNANENMQLDREILQSNSPHPILRLYSFSSFCATIGIFTPREGLLDEEACKNQDIQIATRPSGGGLLFHEEDLSFCLYIPVKNSKGSPLELCKTINGIIIKALLPFLLFPKKIVHFPQQQSRFCYSSVTPFDVVFENRKIGGCAQRRSKHGTLHQGSLFLKTPNWDTIASVISNRDDLHQMRATITPLSELLIQTSTEQILRDSIIQECRKVF